MTFYVVTMTHPDGEGWGTYVRPHVEYLLTLIEAGVLKASGPLPGALKRSGFLIFSVADRAELDRLIAADPFAQHDLIETLTVVEWDPMFGAFAGESSRPAPVQPVDAQGGKA